MYKYYIYGEAGRIYLLPVDVLLVLCEERWTGRIRSIPAVFHSPPLVNQRGVHQLKPNVEGMTKTTFSFQSTP